MSYITNTGNLVAVPELRTSEAGNRWAGATVKHTSRAKDPKTGEWADCGTVTYDLIVTGRQAEQLVAIATAKQQQHGKNLSIMFAGTYKVETFDRRDGTAGVSHKVMVDQWAILPNQDVTVARAGRDN